MNIDHLCNHPEFIGHGYGRIQWDHMIGECKEKDIKKLKFVTSPETKNYYLKWELELLVIWMQILLKTRKFQN